MHLHFTVQGKPQPQGSVRAFMPKGWTRPILTSDNKTLKPWRQDVSAHAREAMEGSLPSESAIGVKINFFFLRPKSTKKSVVHKLTKPDVDKCARSILDSLTGICFMDDSQVVVLAAAKAFCEADERAEIEVQELA